MSIVDFIDLEPIKVTILSLIVMSISIFSSMPEKKDAKFPLWGKIVLIALLFLPLIAAHVQESEAIDNIHNFTQGKNLICKVDDFTYKINKVGGWSVENIYFSKDSTLIRADYCKGL